MKQLSAVLVLNTITNVYEYGQETVKMWGGIRFSCRSND